MHERTNRPNILIFFSDQQRWDTVGAYGCPLDLTPNLDALCREGVRFEHAFTPQPVCGPARSVIQTGLLATKTGVWTNSRPFNRSLRTFAHELSDAGYDLGYIGKWHLSTVQTKPVPLEDRHGWNGVWEAADVIEFTTHPYEGRVFDADGNTIEFKDCYRTDFLTERGLRFLNRERDEKPFCLMVSYLEPHQQNDWNRLVAPEGYAEAIRRNPKGVWIPEDLRGVPGDWGAEWADYLGMVKRLDENLGQFMTALKQSGQIENTLIFYFTDHGCHFRTRNTEYKRSCHDASIHIPFVMAGPGYRGGRVVQELVTLTDVAPTILDEAGIRVEREMDGWNLRPLVAGEAEGWREEVYIQLSEYLTGRAIRTDRWTYCVHAPDKDLGRDSGSDVYVEYQMYDNWADPHQRVNLIGRPAYRAVADELMERLLKNMERAGEGRPQIVKARYYA